MGGCPAMGGCPVVGGSILCVSALFLPSSVDLPPKTHRKKDAKQQYNLNIISKIIIFKFIKQIILKIYLLINFYYIDSFIFNVLIILIILLSLAFLTLLERKLLGYIQIRKGPNKIFFIGILQLFRSETKLFTKELFYMKNLNFLYYKLSSIFRIILI